MRKISKSQAKAKQADAKRCHCALNPHTDVVGFYSILMEQCFDSVYRVSTLEDLRTDSACKICSLLAHL